MSTRFDNPADVLVKLGIAACITFFSVYAVVTQSTLMIILVVGAAPALALINRPQTMVVAIIGLSCSSLLLPGLPRGLHLMHLMMAAFIGVMLARFIILKPVQRKRPASFILAWLMLAWLAFIIHQRGLGLMSGGGNMVGGAAYIKFYLCAGFLLCSRYIALSPQQWRWAILLMVAGSFIPIVAEQLYVHSGGRIRTQYLFIEPYIAGLLQTMDAMESGNAVARLTTFSGVASSLLMAAMVFTTRPGKFRPITYAAVFLCLVFAGLSGFRSLIVEIAALTFLYRLMMARPDSRLRLTLMTAGLVLVAMAIVIPLANNLPLPMQRSLSWLPFVQVDALARQGAEQSTAWRLELWRYSWAHAGDYLLLGRGFAVSMADVLALSVIRDDILQFWFSHTYHSGPLSALIDLGLPGFLLVLVFFIAACREVARRSTRPQTELMQRFEIFIRVKVLYSIFAYIFIFGDVRSTLPSIFIYLAIYHTLEGGAKKPLPAAAPMAGLGPGMGISRLRPPAV